MLDYVHYALLHAVQLYDSLHYWLLRRQLTGELVKGKRPDHVLIMGDSNPTNQHVKLLNSECLRFNVPLVTVLDRNIIDESELEGVVRIKGYDQSLLRHLQSSTEMLTSLPGIPVDLVISTQQMFDLGGTDCTQLGFAELCHIPECEFITTDIFRYALSHYAICQQNCGK
jgi:hypothetical protein